jgi:hypothetical protein
VNGRDLNERDLLCRCCDALEIRALPPLVLCLSVHLLDVVSIWVADLGCGSVSSFETARGA